MADLNLLKTPPPSIEMQESSAPPYSSLYPESALRSPPDLGSALSFRLGKISDIEKEISGEIEHYRLSQKRYKKSHKISYYSSLAFGGVSVALASGAVAGSLTGVGALVGVPISSVAALTGIVSSLFAFLCRRLQLKINKHSEIVSLATSKHDSINRLVSKSLVSNSVSDEEFIAISEEMDKYRSLKRLLRARYSNKSVDIEQLRAEVKREIHKKIDT